MAINFRIGSEVGADTYGVSGDSLKSIVSLTAIAYCLPFNILRDAHIIVGKLGYFKIIGTGIESHIRKIHIDQATHSACTGL